MSKPKVIIIDDNLANLIALEQLLTKLDVQVEKYNSSAEALTAMLREPVDCAIVDVDMPDIDGIEFTKTVKNDPQLKVVPILLVTGKIFSENKLSKAFKIGAYDYVTKPYSAQSMLAKVQLLVDYSVCRRQSLENESILDSKLLESLESIEQKLKNNDPQTAQKIVVELLTYLRRKL